MEEILHSDPYLIERLEFLEKMSGSCTEKEWEQTLKNNEERAMVRTRSISWETWIHFDPVQRCYTMTEAGKWELVDWRQIQAYNAPNDS